MFEGNEASEALFERLWDHIMASEKRSRQKKQETVEENEQDLAPKAEPLTPIDSFVDMSINNSSERTFPTSPNGTLTLLPGSVKIQLRFEKREEWADQSEGIDYPAMYLRITDAQGRRWEAKRHFQPILFSDCLNPPSDSTDSPKFPELSIPEESCVTPIPKSDYLFWDDIPEDWKEAFQSCCLLVNAADLDDCRFYNDLLISNKKYTVKFKYQMPQVSLAYIKNDNSLCVRIVGLYYWTMKDNEPDDYLELPAFCYKFAIKDVLPFGDSDSFFCDTHDGWFEKEESKEPQVLTFTRIESNQPAQKNVLFKPC